MKFRAAGVSSWVLIAGISIVCGVFIFFISRFLFPTEAFLGESYAVLAVDEFQDDRRINEMLAAGGMDNFFSESSMFVPIDDFGTIRQIPLDSFHNEIESYDPRNIGYADELRLFFVRDGKRFFFSPVEENIANLRKHISAILDDIPFTLSVLGRKESVLLYLVFLSAACLAALYLTNSRRLFAAQIPVLIAIGCMGSISIVLAVVLAGLWELLRGPLKELFAIQYYKNSRFNYAGNGVKGFLQRLKPFRLNLILVLFFLILLPVFSITGFLSPLLLSVVFASFISLYLLSFKAETERSRKVQHILFTPVVLAPLRTKTFFLFPFLLPFGIVALFVLVSLQFFPGFLSLPQKETSLDPLYLDSRYFVSPEKYYDHLAFQRSFSYRSLNHSSQEALNQEDYMRYYLAEDGLIGGYTYHGISDEIGEFRLNQPPPEPIFPMEKLMDFLVNYDKQNAGKALDSKPAALPVIQTELISVVILLVFCMLDLLKPGIVTRRKIQTFGDKRIAA